MVSQRSLGRGVRRQGESGNRTNISSGGSGGGTITSSRDVGGGFTEFTGETRGMNVVTTPQDEEFRRPSGGGGRGGRASLQPRVVEISTGRVVQEGDVPVQQAQRQTPGRVDVTKEVNAIFADRTSRVPAEFRAQEAFTTARERASTSPLGTVRPSEELEAQRQQIQSQQSQLQEDVTQFQETTPNSQAQIDNLARIEAQEQARTRQQIEKLGFVFNPETNTFEATNRKSDVDEANRLIDEQQRRSEQRIAIQDQVISSGTTRQVQAEKLRTRAKELNLQSTKFNQDIGAANQAANIFAQPQVFKSDARRQASIPVLGAGAGTKLAPLTGLQKLDLKLAGFTSKFPKTSPTATFLEKKATPFFTSSAIKTREAGQITGSKILTGASKGFEAARFGSQFETGRIIETGRTVREQPVSKILIPAGIGFAVAVTGGLAAASFPAIGASLAPGLTVVGASAGVIGTGIVAQETIRGGKIGGGKGAGTSFAKTTIPLASASIGAGAGAFTTAKFVQFRLRPRVSKEANIFSKPSPSPKGTIGASGRAEVGVLQRSTPFGKSVGKTELRFFKTTVSPQGAGQQSVAITRFTGFKGRFISVTQQTNLKEFTTKGGFKFTRNGLTSEGSLVAPRKIEPSGLSRPRISKGDVRTGFGIQSEQIKISGKVNIFPTGKKTITFLEKGAEVRPGVFETTLTKQGSFVKPDVINSIVLKSLGRKGSFALTLPTSKGNIIPSSGDIIPRTPGFTQTKPIVTTTAPSVRAGFPVIGTGGVAKGLVFTQSVPLSLNIAGFLTATSVGALSGGASLPKSLPKVTPKSISLTENLGGVNTLVGSLSIPIAKLGTASKVGTVSGVKSKVGTVTQTITNTIPRIPPPPVNPIPPTPFGFGGFGFLLPGGGEAQGSGGRSRTKKTKPKRKFVQTLFGVTSGARLTGKRRTFTGFEKIR